MNKVINVNENTIYNLISICMGAWTIEFEHKSSDMSIENNCDYLRHKNFEIGFLVYDYFWIIIQYTDLEYLYVHIQFL